jgi:hypothetical protein
MPFPVIAGERIASVIRRGYDAISDDPEKQAGPSPARPIREIQGVIPPIARMA